MYTVQTHLERSVIAKIITILYYYRLEHHAEFETAMANAITTWFSVLQWLCMRQSQIFQRAGYTRKLARFELRMGVDWVGGLIGRVC